MKLPKRILLILGIIFLLMQLFPVDRSIPENTDPKKDFFALVQAEPEMMERIKASCYDCHSHESTYPWYAYVAPFSWIIQDHVNEGREHLNFSLWADYSQKEQMHKLEEAVEEVEKGEMPLKGYLTYHKEARFDLDERQELLAFLNQLRR
jgi:hypothetical protein